MKKEPNGFFNVTGPFIPHSAGGPYPALAGIAPALAIEYAA